MRQSVSSRNLSVLLVTLFATSILAAPGASAAYTVLPKVGQCFQYTKAQVSSAYAPKNPIRCSSKHNMETFAVITWPLNTNPADMDKKDASDLAFELCDFFGTFPNAENSRSSTTSFNYWAWYTPSRSAWAKGQRWLRCDAMIGKFTSADQWPPATYVSWRGLKLNNNY